MPEHDEMLLKVNLKQLRLPTILAEFEKLAKEAAEENAAYSQYLLRLSELEVATRTANALKNRIKQAAFPTHKDFDSYDFSVMPSLNKQKVLELARCEWLDKHENSCLIGNDGTGKNLLTSLFSFLNPAMHFNCIACFEIRNLFLQALCFY